MSRPVTLITGGTGGMGIATARIAASEGPVLLCDLDEDKLRSEVSDLSSTGAEVHGVRCDVTDADSVGQAFAAAMMRVSDITLPQVLV